MDTLVKAMEIFPIVHLEKLPRMADFTRWGYAIAESSKLVLCKKACPTWTSERLIV